MWGLSPPQARPSARMEGYSGHSLPARDRGPEWQAWACLLFGPCQLVPRKEATC